MRYAIACGLNVCPPFDGLSTSNTASSSLIQAAENAYEDEMRRNAFWSGRLFYVVALGGCSHPFSIPDGKALRRDEQLCDVLGR